MLLFALRSPHLVQRVIRGIIITMVIFDCNKAGFGFIIWFSKTIIWNQTVKPNPVMVMPWNCSYVMFFRPDNHKQVNMLWKIHFYNEKVQKKVLFSKKKKIRLHPCLLHWLHAPFRPSWIREILLRSTFRGFSNPVLVPCKKNILVFKSSFGSIVIKHDLCD